MSERLDFTLRLIDKITGPAKKATKALAGINKQTTALGKNPGMKKFTDDTKAAGQATKSLSERGSGLISLAGSMSMASNAAMQLGRAATGALLMPIKEAATFEQAMSRVQARTADFNAEQVETAKRLGRDTKFTAVEAAQGMEKLAMAGFNAKQQVSALGDVLNLDAASGMNNVARTSDLVTDIMGGFQIQAEDLTASSDILVRVLNNSNTTLEGLGQTMSFAAPVAKQLGVSLQDTAVLAGALGDAGIKGSRGGTALRLMLVNLAGASPPAMKALKKFNIETSDAAGNMLPIQGLLAGIAKRFKGLGNAQKTVLARDIFGQRGLSAGLILLEGISNRAGGSITKLNNAVGDMGTTAASTAETMEDNLLGDVTKVESAISGLKIAIGDELRPELRALAKDTKDSIGPMTEWVSKNKDMVKTIAKVTAVVAAVMITVAVVAKTAATIALIFGGAMKIWAGIVVAVKAVAGAWAAISFSGIAGFFSTLIVGAKVIGGIIVAIVGWPVIIAAALAGVIVALTVWWDDVSAFMGRAGAKMYDFGQNIADSLIAGWKAAIDFLPASVQSFLGVSSDGGSARMNGRTQLSSEAAKTVADNSKRSTDFRPTVNVSVAAGTDASSGEAIGQSVTDQLRSMFDGALATQGG